MPHTGDEKRDIEGTSPIGIKLRRLPAEKRLLTNSAVA